MHLDARLFADGSLLLARGGALHVGRDQQRVALAALEPAPELGRGRGLARALQARHQDDGGRRRSHPQRDRLGPREDRDHLVAHDAQHGLVGAEAPQHLLARGGYPHAVEQLLGDFEVDVRLEQRQTDLAQRGVDLGLAEHTVAPQGPEDPLKPLAQRLEQGHPPPARRTPSQSK
jgi:hypothetical protein